MKIMRGKLGKIFSLLIVILFVFGTTSVYAQSFTDVKDSHWASDYIEKMNKKGIITGYSDATFRPNGDVTKEAAVIMISRLYGLDDDTKKDLVEKYQAFLDDVNVANWAESGIAIGLEKDIVTKDIVRDFYKNGKSLNARRDEVCLYLTRAMGLEDEAEDKVIVNLDFIDSDLMPISVRACVQVMVEKGVIAETNGKFNPKNPVTRAAMAKMLAVAYDYMEDNDVVEDNLDEEVEENPFKGQDTFNVEGKIKDTLPAKNEVYMTVIDEDDEKTTCVVNSKTDITLDGDDVDLEDIVEGLDVEVELTEELEAVEVIATSVTAKYSGKIESISSGSPSKLEIEYEVEDEDGDTDTEEETFYIDEDCDIELDNENSHISKLDKGDIVEIDVKNNKIVEIKAESKNRNIDGELKDIKFDPKPIIVIEDEDENTYEFEVDDHADIERNNDDVEITDLRVGDELDIEVEYEIVEEIEAETVEKEDEGTIKSILISDEPKLTIKNDDDDIETYFVSNDVDIELARRTSTLYDLRLGYFVELEIESSEIVKIDAIERQINDDRSGIVKYINRDAEVISIKVPGESETIRIDVTDDTNFIDTDGDKTRFRTLDEGDEVLVIGSSDGGIYTAKTIIIKQSY
ncbi:MAG: S-layer homology domain-containing protein [Firmicutes bacterium]|nr:S-layer homology domain-containing protein [Bacillota bacterium]